jgi:hypothetical protein
MSRCAALSRGHRTSEPLGGSWADRAGPRRRRPRTGPRPCRPPPTTVVRARGRPRHACWLPRCAGRLADCPSRPRCGQTRASFVVDDSGGTSSRPPRSVFVDDAGSVTQRRPYEPASYLAARRRAGAQRHEPGSYLAGAASATDPVPSPGCGRASGNRGQAHRGVDDAPRVRGRDGRRTGPRRPSGGRSPAARRVIHRAVPFPSPECPLPSTRATRPPTPAARTIERHGPPFPRQYDGDDE